MQKKFLVRMLCVAAVSCSALAQTTDPKISLAVTSVGTKVTVSETTATSTFTPPTYAAYIFSFVNGGGSDLNQTVFKLTVSATSGLTVPKIQPQSVNPDLPTSCTISADGATALCDYSGAALPPGFALQFPVIVSAPQYATTTVVPGSISLKADGTFREGKSSTASGSSLGAASSTASHTVTQLAFDTVDSVVVKTGGTLFTGAKGLPTPTDPQSTSVRFQALTSVNYDLVNITEAEVTGTYATTCTADKYFKKCYETTLSAPKVKYTSGAYLTETIRVHTDNLAKPVSQMPKVIWYYTSPSVLNGTPQPIGLCASSTTPSGTGVPCQTKPVMCYDAKTPPPPGEQLNTCVWEFINTENGLIRPML